MEQYRKRPRLSIVWKLFASLLLCIVLLLAVNWLLNNFVLVSYYQNVKKDLLVRAFHRIDSLILQNEDGVQEELDELDSSQNISAMVWNGPTLLYDMRPGGRPGGSYLILTPSGIEPGNYRITVRAEEATKNAFITLDGTLNNGYSIKLRTPVAAIEESVGITNQFLLISGTVTVLIGLVFVLFIARSFTKPIRDLSRIAGNVAKLDFSDRYTGRRNDEMADLGNSLNSMSASLEKTISDLKTANLQLLSDNRQKTRQNEAHRAFISNVSHELKTPIALIQTYAEGLRENIAGGGESRDYYCEVIEDEAQKMTEMLKKLTTLMQLEAGGGELVIERFDIAELLRNLMEKNNILFAQRGIVPAAPPARPVYVWADAFLIENVLTNYLSNALHHVEDGGRVEASVRPVEGGRVRISVFNTGQPIPEDDLPRIWESFYKVDKARTRAYGGSGIGLSVVAAIMNAHHMPYGVFNREDKRTGVEFYIELESR